MKIFISWSGSRERAVAVALQETLPLLCSAKVEVFVSSTSISKGADGIAVIKANLDGSDFGIVLISSANQAEPWLNYEGGWLSSRLERPVATVLLDLRISDITTPLAPQQATNFDDENDMEQLLRQIAKLANPDMPDEAFTVLLRAVWPKIHAAWQPLDEDADVAPVRSDSDMLSEIVERVRRLEDIGSATHHTSREALHRSLLADERSLAHVRDSPPRSAGTRFERAIRRTVERESGGTVSLLDARLQGNRSFVTLLASRFADPDTVRRMERVVSELVEDTALHIEVIVGHAPPNEGDEPDESGVSQD